MNRRVTLLVLAFTAFTLLLHLPAQAGTLLVANKSEDTLALIDTEAGAVRATLPTGDAPHEVAVSPDGRFALVANYGAGRGGGTLTVVDIPGAEVVKTIQLGAYRRPHGVVFLDERRALVTAEANQALLEVDLRSGEILRAFETGQRTSHMVVASADGHRAYVANIGSGTVTVIDLASGEKVQDVSTGAGAEGIALTPDGSRVWVSNREAGTVSVLDTASLEIIAELSCEGVPIRAEITPNGRYVLVSSARAGALCVFDAQDRTLVRRVSLRGRHEIGGRPVDLGDSPAPVGIQIAPQGQRAWIALTNADQVVELNLETWELTRSFPTGDEPDGMAYSPLVVVGPGSEDPSGD